MKKRKQKTVKSKRKKKTEFTYEVFNNPFKAMNDKERREFIKETAQKAGEKYIERLPELQNIAKEQDPLSLLSTLMP